MDEEGTEEEKEINDGKSCQVRVRRRFSHSPVWLCMLVCVCSNMSLCGCVCSNVFFCVSVCVQECGCVFFVCSTILTFACVFPLMCVLMYGFVCERLLFIEKNNNSEKFVKSTLCNSALSAP